MKTKWKLLIISVALLVGMFVLAGTASAETLSGDCSASGSNVTWTLDTETGVLTISGTGAMEDWSSAKNVPWHNYCASVKIVSIGFNVIRIGDYAFTDCVNIGYISCFWYNEIKIGTGNEYFTNALTHGYCGGESDWTNIEWELNIDTGVLEISGSGKMMDFRKFNYYPPWYFYRDRIQTVKILEGVTSVDQAFFDCYSLEKIILPASLDYFSSVDGSFSHCGKLAEFCVDADNPNYSSESGVLFNKGKTELLYYPTGRSESVYQIPESVLRIQGESFSECKNLKNVQIPNKVTSIGVYAFSGCSGLTSVTIPSSVSVISKGAFQDCDMLSQITVDNKNNFFCSDDGILFNKAKDTLLAYPAGKTVDSYQIPKGVTGISGHAFCGCHNLTSVIIPDGVTSIGDFAFCECSNLRSIILPDSLKSIQYYAFSRCNALTTVRYSGNLTGWNNINIEKDNTCLTNATILFPTDISVLISDGGNISLGCKQAWVGDTVTVNAIPYAGYELTAVYVDGKALTGSTFTVTGNHEVSAVFTLLPVYGGTDEYRLSGITVTTAAGEKVQELTKEQLLVSISIEHLQGTEGTTVMLAQYDAKGQYRGMLWVTVKKSSVGMALEITVPLDNTKGEVANLKAFVVGSIQSPTPVGNAVSFGNV